MKNLIKRIAQALVDHPEQVEVLGVEGEQVHIKLISRLANKIINDKS